MNNSNNCISWTASLLSESPHNQTKKISTDQYIEWQKQWIVDALKGYRLGQSFCEYFGISNASPLYYFRDNSFSNMWIHDNYINV